LSFLWVVQKIAGPKSSLPRYDPTYILLEGT